MGYETSFTGQFNISIPLKPEHLEYIIKFCDTRRMRRNATLTAKRPDRVREAAGLPVGPDGAFFVGETGVYGQDNSEDIVEYNSPPSGQPDLWCHWTSNPEGTAIEWDNGEKFYEYVPWLSYILDNFLKPWGYVLNGEVEWTGEDPDDRGKIVVKDNVIRVLHAKIVFE